MDEFRRQMDEFRKSFPQNFQFERKQMEQLQRQLQQMRDHNFGLAA
jgi:hypothetical protein